MDNNSLSLGILPRDVDIAITSTLFVFIVIIGLVEIDKSEFSNPVFWFAVSLSIFSYCTIIPLRLSYRQKPKIASRIQAVIDIYVREMDNLLALMKLWESRSCQKVDDYRNDEDTMTRLRSFLNAIEFLDLTNKIYELKGLSSHLNLVTKRLIRSPLLKAIDLITTWDIIGNFYLFRFSVSDG